MSLKAYKSELRKKYLGKRNALTPQERTTYSQAIAQHFLASEFANYKSFHIYISIDKFNEIETQHIIQALWKKDKTVVIPKMQGKSLLNCIYTPHTAMSKNNWGILEPTSCEQITHHTIDVVLVPLLISDQQGNRIGYGGGFYDRFLPQLRKDCKLVGINYFEPINHISNETHDIPLDYLITPNGIRTVGAN